MHFSSDHGEGVHRIVFKVFKNTALVRIAKELDSCTLDFRFRRMLGRSADTSAFADHRFDEVLRQSAHGQQLDTDHAVFSAGALAQLDIGCILTAFLHAFKNRRCDTAAAGEALSVYGGFLIILFNRFKFDILRLEQGCHLTECQNIVRIAFNAHFLGFALFRDARADEYGHAVRMLGLEES